MKYLLVTLLLATSVQASDCDLNLYFPELTYTSEEFQANLMKELSDKGYTNIKRISIPAETTAPYSLELRHTSLRKKSLIQLLDTSLSGSESIIFQKDKKYFSQAGMLNAFGKLVQSLPECPTK